MASATPADDVPGRNTSASEELGFGNLVHHARWPKVADAVIEAEMLSEAALSYAIQQYLTHYHAERNHQGLGNQLIAPEPGMVSHSGQVRRRERLGGLRRYYYSAAA